MVANSAFARYGLRRVINAAGTMTYLGASSVKSDVSDTMASILPEFVRMDELQSRASALISSMTGAEAGVATNCAASGIALACAACITGDDIGAIEGLPVREEPRPRFLIQMGHCVDFGARMEQLIALSGGIPRVAGSANRCSVAQLQSAAAGGVLGALYVISHHCVLEEQVSLPAFIECCHKHEVPVIVDAASEYDLRTPIEMGADIVVYSGHKFLGGPTSGIVAGRRDLVRSIYMNQERGIGRAMKVGKESIVGAMAALEAWRATDHSQKIQRERHRSQYAMRELSRIDGIAVSESPDPTGNPITRVAVRVDESVCGMSAAFLAERLAAGDPSIVVRSEHLESGLFELDPCNLTDNEMALVCARIAELITDSRSFRKSGEAARPAVVTEPRVDENIGLWVRGTPSHLDRTLEALRKWPYE